MNRQTKVLMGAVGLAVMISGCATQPPPALIHARAAVATAEQSASSDVPPEELRAVHRALDDAEYEFEQHGDGPETQAAAYVAQRRALGVRVKGARNAKR